ncbi:hypothetical protein CCUS01_09744 [Colletotrichum cuscutae]|uniref:Uncharacterized protein n=1 Tax=Colletotrichum cuscutae TaxID=1209917 RepID=A0AAI9UIG1_9PEZI|nr:hypothetical protein CCUS01_09744 [Colletotrichum cuscutae]
MRHNGLPIDLQSSLGRFTVCVPRSWPGDSPNPSAAGCGGCYQSRTDRTGAEAMDTWVPATPVLPSCRVNKPDGVTLAPGTRAGKTREQPPSPT